MSSASDAMTVSIQTTDASTSDTAYSCDQSPDARQGIDAVAGRLVRRLAVDGT